MHSNIGYYIPLSPGVQEEFAGRGVPRCGAGKFLYLSPTASFLSAAKEKRKRNAAKNYVFGFPYAASPDFSLVEISRANVVP